MTSNSFDFGGEPKTVINGGLFLKSPRSKKDGSKVFWQKHQFRLTTDGKLKQLKGGTMCLQQRTRIYQSEFREHCFTICTPSEKKIVLAAASEDEKMQWMEALENACRSAPPTNVKVVLVGDDKVAQQKLLHAFFQECGQVKLAEEVLAHSYKSDNVELTLNLEVTKEKVKLVLCCVCAEDYPKLRVLNYVDANAFLLCFSADRISEFENVEKVWWPETKNYVENGASMFVVGLHHKRDEEDSQPVEKEEIDRLVGQELADYLNSTFFDVNLDESLQNELNPERDVGSEAGQSSTACFDSPAETFLDVLQATLEDSHGGFVSGSEASTDVANMGDFKNYWKGGSKTGSFVNFVKQKSRAAGRKFMSVGGRPTNIDGSSEKMNVGTLQRLKNILRNMRPKQKKKKDHRPKLNEEEQQKAHYVSRSQQGSLVFLGDEFLDVDN